MYEDFNYKLKQSLVDVNKDIFALHYSFEDMVDEIAKRKMPLPAEGEVLIKLD
jgi:cell division protein FtsB